MIIQTQLFTYSRRDAEVHSSLDLNFQVWRVWNIHDHFFQIISTLSFFISTLLYCFTFHLKSGKPFISTFATISLRSPNTCYWSGGYILFESLFSLLIFSCQNWKMFGWCPEKFLTKFNWIEWWGKNLHFIKEATEWRCSTLPFILQLLPRDYWHIIPVQRSDFLNSTVSWN